MIFLVLQLDTAVEAYIFRSGSGGGGGGRGATGAATDIASSFVSICLKIRLRYSMKKHLKP